MAETNKSQMMSEAEIIEAINADSLISVSLGAGQPQKNVKMSTLASVAAGLMGYDSTIYKTKDASGIKANSLSNGTYLIKNRSTSDGYPCAWGVIVSMVTGMGAGFQLAFDASSSSMLLKYRVQWDTVWGAWKDV